MIKITAEDMFDVLSSYNARVQRAVTNRQYKEIEKAREVLDRWFAERGIILVEREQG